MNLRTGIVVATHPEDYSVDLVMTDDGSRLAGVQLLTPSASTRTGTVDLPAVPAKANKWDVTKISGQDMKAIVGYVGVVPVVVGFLYPQINQMLLNDPLTRISRHQSDVYSMIDGDGNMELRHPNGTYIRIGETADSVDMQGKNADANFKTDRNTGRSTFVRLELAGNVAQLTMTPEGECTLLLEKSFNLVAQENINMEAVGNIDIKAGGTISMESGGAFGITSGATLATGSAGATTITAESFAVNAATSTASGSFSAQNNITTPADVVAGPISLKGHKHTEQGNGQPTSPSIP